jgi:serine/threonine protein kinase
MARGLLKYHIVGTLWVGQTSIVYRATDANNRLVAVKMLLPDTATSRSAQRMMDREARLMLAMDHPNIVEAIEYVRNAPMPALVMEYFESENLKMRIVRSPEFIHTHAQAIISQTCQALAYVHEHKLVHRDMKPENILVADDGTTKILDFALSEDLGGGWFSGLIRRKIAGTRPYIAPETIRRRAPDTRTDIYSLGVTLYEMLTGRPPFVADDRNDLLRKHLVERPPSLRTYNPAIHSKMDDLVMHMLAKSPKNRPENMEEIIRRLEPISVFDK